MLRGARYGNRLPYVKGLTIMVDSVFSGGRMEDVWFDK
jgi:hypothetical protein